MIWDYVNLESLKNASKDFKNNVPFDHCIVENFFKEGIAEALEKEFPEYNSMNLHTYDNAIEVKKVSNDWNNFGQLTYKIFNLLNSSEFVNKLSELFGIDVLFADNGLNGGGWHMHRSGGKLNTHLDYSIHPKLGLQRKLNLLVYMNSSWEESWGGKLGLWEHDEKNNTHGKLIKEVIPAFNRAVIFDTTQNSWHGLPESITCPEDEYRRSLAVYYLTTPPANVDPRGKALFTPYKNQKSDKKVLELIKKRSEVSSAKNVYK